MYNKVWVSAVVVAAALAGGVAARRAVWKRTPPFESGFHTEVVSAETKALPGPPRIANCQIFPADNIWNTPIDKLSKDAHSDQYIQSIGYKMVHPDFGTKYGIPFSEVPPKTPSVDVTFDYKDESDLGKYPIPANAPAELDEDSHILLIDGSDCHLYELYAAHNTDGHWHAGSGIKMDLRSNALRSEGMTSADAAGLPILPGLVRFDEVASGEIHHALRFTVPHTYRAFLWPARHQAGTNDPKTPPMGARFRLRADFDTSKYSETNQVIMKALKKYGMFVADNGGPMFITGVPDKRWDDGDLHRLGDMKSTDFEMVDESKLQAQPDSAKVEQSALR